MRACGRAGDPRDPSTIAVTARWGFILGGSGSAAIEEAYAKQLAKLAKSQLGDNETGYVCAYKGMGSLRQKGLLTPPPKQHERRVDVSEGGPGDVGQRPPQLCHAGPYGLVVGLAGRGNKYGSRTRQQLLTDQDKAIMTFKDGQKGTRKAVRGQLSRPRGLLCID